MSYSVSLLGVLSNDATDEAKYKHEIFKYTPHKILQMKPIWRTIFLSMFISFLYIFRATMCPLSGEILHGVDNLSAYKEFMFRITRKIKQYVNPSYSVYINCRSV